MQDSTLKNEMDASKQNKVPSGTVYLFGAGTSRWAGAPLVKDFRTASESLKLGEDVNGFPRYVAHDVGDNKFRSALEWWDEVAPGSNIEEFYILAELMNALEKPDADDEFGAAAAERLHNVEFLIAKTLQRTVRGDSKEHRYHDLMLRLIHAPLLPPDQVSGIITLNWDTSVESAAKRIGMQLDLGLATHATGRLPFFKLHGSLNWTFDGEQDRIDVEPDEKSLVVIWEREPYQHLSAWQAQAVFVPPTTQKLTGDSGPLAELWRRAQVLLSSAHRLVIVGYSFPPTDVQFRMYLVRALQENTDLQSIVIVNPPLYGSRRMQFEDHYAAMFASSIHLGKLKFQYQTYEEWVDSECPLPP